MLSLKIPWTIQIYIMQIQYLVQNTVQNQKPSNCLSHPGVDFEAAHQIQNQFDIKSYLSTEH